MTREERPPAGEDAGQRHQADGALVEPGGPGVDDLEVEVGVGDGHGVARWWDQATIPSKRMLER